MNARFLGQTMFSPEGNNLSQVIHRFAEIPFDDLTHLASHLAQTPIALITFMDVSHQWLKSQVGLTEKIHPYLNFCEFIIYLQCQFQSLREDQEDPDHSLTPNSSNSTLKLSPEPIIIPDTWDDQRFSSQPLVKQDHGIRFYLGIPLITTDNLMVGMLSIMDYQPRKLSPETIKALQALNNQIISQINLHRQLIHSKTKLSQLEDIINERKQVWEVVRQERDFVCAVLDTVSALVIVLDPDGRIIRFNRTCEQLTGYSAEEVEGKTFDELGVNLLPLDSGSQPHSGGMMIEFDEPPKSVKTQNSVPLIPNHTRLNAWETEWVKPNGQRHWITWSNTALFQANGLIKYVIATGIDITERRQSEVRMELLERAITASPSGIVISDFAATDCPIIYCNPAFEKLTGYSQEEVLGRNCRMLQGEDTDPKELARLRDAIAQNTDCSVTLKNYQKMGK